MTENPTLWRNSRTEYVDLLKCPWPEGGNVDGLLENEAFWILIRYLTGINCGKQKMR